VKLPTGTGPRIRLPSSSEIAAIRAAMRRENYKQLLDFLEDTGCRISEACALDWRDVHADRVVVRGTKRASSVRSVLGETWPVRLLAEEKSAGRVFPVSVSAMRNAMANDDPAEHFSPHDLRHLHASRLLHAGVSPAIVAERLGHRLPTLLSTYAHVMPPD
jgi:integrase